MFPTESTGYAVGRSGTLVKTVDYGNTWNVYEPAFEEHLYSVFFTNENVGFIAGRYGLFFKTIDGGNNWNQIDLGTDSDLESIVFVNENIGFVVGEDNTVFNTVNGGENWISVTLLGSEEWQNWEKVYFINNGVGYIQDEGSSSYKTEDYGNNWIESDRDDFFHITEDIGFSGFSDIYKTTNGGIDWLAEVNPGSGFRSAFFFNENNGFIVGNDGSIIRTTNGGGFHFVNHSPEDNLIFQSNEQCHLDWQSDQLSNFTVDINLYQEYNFVMEIASGVVTQSGMGEFIWNIPEIVSSSTDYKIIISSNDEILVPIEIEITLLQESDMRFYRHNLPVELSDVHVNYMQFYNGKLWFCGFKGTVAYSSDDDFENWTIVNNGIPDDEKLCWMDQADTDIFITGSYSGKIYRTINSGQSWDLVFSDSTVTDFINYVKAFPETGEVIVHGDGIDEDSPMALLYSDDFGVTWINNNILLLGEANPWKTVFISRDLGYITGNSWPDYEHLIYKTDDLGVSWTEINPFSPNDYVIESISFKDENLGIATVGSYTSITRDGGESWHINSEQVYYQISFIDSYHAFSNGTFFDFNEEGIITHSRDISHDNYSGTYSFFDSEGNGFICAGASSSNRTGWFSSTIVPPVTSIDGGETELLPSDLTLHQNYPNPFNPETVISFSLKKDQNIKLSIYNIKGELVEDVVNKKYDKGNHQVIFDGSKLTSGQYFYKLEAGNVNQVKKMLFLK